MSDSDTTPSGKGRATPKRRDAESAARAKAAGSSTHGLSGPQRRKAMRAGDERFIPARFRGEVMTFIRDWVDRKARVTEWVLPLLLGAIFLSVPKIPVLSIASSSIQLATFISVAIEIYLMRRGLLRDLALRYPNEDTKGKVLYAVSRAMQMRFMRQPQVSIGRGQALPQRYVYSKAGHRWIGHH